MSQLELLKLSHRTAVPRHRTLKATLDWSYDLLSDAERIVFRRVAPFVGHFTLEAARNVAGELGTGTGEIFDAIAGLVEKSLIATRIDETQAQYRLLDTTRAYALEKLEEHAEVDVVSPPACGIRRRPARIAKSCYRLCQALKEPQPIPGNSAMFGRRWNGALGRTATTRSRRDSRPLQRSCFMELSLLIECQSWAEQAIARLGDQHKNSRREMEIYASLSLALMHSEGSSERVREAFSRALDVAAIQETCLRAEAFSGLFMYSRWNIDIHARSISPLEAKRWR